MILSVNRLDGISPKKVIQTIKTDFQRGHCSLLLHDTDRPQQSRNAAVGKHCFVEQILVPDPPDIALHIIRERRILPAPEPVLQYIVHTLYPPLLLGSVILTLPECEAQRKGALPVFLLRLAKPLQQIPEHRQIHHLS